MEVGAHARTSSVKPARNTVGVSIPYRAGTVRRCRWSAPAPGRPGAAASEAIQILDASSGATYHTAYRDVNLNCIIR